MKPAHDTTRGGEELPDWGSYTAEELREALDGLDRERYPERVKLIEDHLQRRCRESPARRDGGDPDYLRAPDWANYTAAELEQALESLDRDRYPEREVTIREWLERRRGATDAAG